MRSVKYLGMVAGLLLLAVSSQARAVSINTLSVAQFSLELDLYSNGSVDYGFSTPIVPPADIIMGLYQDLPGGIISLASGTSSATVYTTGLFGKAAPSGTVNEPAAGDINVDLSSLRANIIIPSVATLDFELWPLVLPPSAGTYNVATGDFSLIWDVNFSHSATIYGTASVVLNGTVSVVPVPAALWLFGSGLLGLAGIVRRKRAS